MAELLMSQTVLWSLAVCAIGAALFRLSRTFIPKSYGAPLPPGPPGHWLFGNTPPVSHAYRHYAELTEEYGPVFTIRYGGRLVCVIGRCQAAVDIMTKHSHELIDRPRSIVAGEVISGGMRILLIGEGERLRKLRMSMHALLEPHVSAAYEPIQMHHALNRIIDLIERPEAHLEHARKYAASVIMAVTYGKTTPTSYSDPEIQDVMRCIARLNEVLQPKGQLADSFPILQYIPGYLSQARRYHQDELRLFRSQVDIVKEQLAKNEAQPCFVTYLLDHQDESGLTDDELAYLAGSMFGAGSDTTAAALGVVTMAAACYPNAQAKVQAQLDKVVGRDRPPTFADQDMLPEVTAYALEVLRWRPVAAQGFAHKATKDIIWQNYVIPAGAEVLGCHWAISRDPAVFPDPEIFRPERWLNEDGRLRDDMKFFTFGFGRRICPGRHVADRSIFINTALVLWAFNILPDLHKPIDRMAFKDGPLAHPEPFTVQFNPRIDDLKKKVSLYME
ncbi:O-methylsterigmatocystin oxidoreductase [Grifola frondosa]|uniref:O-methylsterigmatocystin oxidoreductase n=1 Tax=Grifola frondosa TaxID=5627 RepID=A0A1C7LVW7_GRIFR|nr:O-methylsterigmatocystin oxidoreductase [Grifola frondosa]